MLETLSVTVWIIGVSTMLDGETAGIDFQLGNCGNCWK